MNGIIIHKFGERGALERLPLESICPGELLVAVNVAAVNPFDWKVRDGVGGDRPMPFVLGQDFAGVVKDVCGDGSNFAIGDRVFGIAGQHGSFAQVTVVNPRANGTVIGKIPPGVSDAVAAALPTPGIAGLASVEALDVGPGSSVMIHGAVGAVGSVATQIAKQRGMRVIASVRGNPDAAFALGADAVVDTSVTDVIAGIKAAQPHGVDALIDFVSPSWDQLGRFADVLRTGGTIVTTNFAADVDALQKCGIRGVNLAALKTPQATRSSLEQLGAMVAAGSLTLNIAREIPYELSADVLDATKAGTMPGKTLLIVKANAKPVFEGER